MEKVKWIVADKRLIKFYKGEAYEVAENVDISNIKTDMEVEPKIEKNIVVSLKVSEAKKESKKEEPKVEEKKEEQVTEVNEEPTIVTWTVSAITSNLEVIKFEEQEVKKYWYLIKEDIRNSFKGIKKGDVITVKIAKLEAVSTKGEKYMKDGIVGLKIEEQKQPETTTTNDSKTVTIETEQKSATPIANSIERQVALKGAIELVLAQNFEKEEDIERFLNKFTKVCLSAMKNA